MSAIIRMSLDDIVYNDALSHAGLMLVGPGAFAPRAELPCGHPVVNRMPGGRCHACEAFDGKPVRTRIVRVEEEQ
jgi:hypothetical protein